MPLMGSGILDDHNSEKILQTKYKFIHFDISLKDSYNFRSVLCKLFKQKFIEVE